MHVCNWAGAKQVASATKDAEMTGEARVSIMVCAELDHIWLLEIFKLRDSSSWRPSFSVGPIRTPPHGSDLHKFGDSWHHEKANCFSNCALDR